MTPIPEDLVFVEREDSCDRCKHLGPWNRNKAWCRKRDKLIYVTSKGYYRYVTSHGESERHYSVGTCEKWEPKDGD